MITLYSTGCPRCKVLTQKLDAANINYSISNNIDEIMTKGFMSVPVLKVNDEYMDFGTAIKWVNNQ